LIAELAEIVAEVYEYLKNCDEVAFPGSIRSYITAIKDAYMRLLLEPCLTPEKVPKIVSRIIYQNISPSLVLKKNIDLVVEIEHAVCRAVQKLEQKKCLKERTKTETKEKSHEIENIPWEDRAKGLIVEVESSLPSLKEAPLILSQSSLAILVKDIDINFRKEAKQAEHSRDVLSRKVFAYFPDKSHLVSIREYSLYTPSMDVDLMKTSVNISRKKLFGKRFSQRDIIVREYSGSELRNSIVCIDVSGSMRELEGTVPKIELAKKAVSKYLNHLAHIRGRFSLIAFNYRAEVLFKLEDARRKRDKIESIVSKLWASGGTNLHAALTQARNILKKCSGKCHIIVVSDGKTVFKKKCISEARILAKRGAILSSIAIGRSSDREFMIKLSKIGGGVFHYLSSYKGLSKALIDSDASIRKFYA